MRKELAKTEIKIPGQFNSKLTQKNIAKALLQIFSDHIGRENSISRSELFNALYKKNYNNKDLADFVRWDFLKKAMQYLRKYSNCFIVSEHREKEYHYFVIRKQTEAQIYVDVLDRNINEMKKLQKRAVTAAEKQWYKENFVLSERTKRKQIK